MAKRDKRVSRYTTLKTFYEMYKAGILAPTPEENLEKAKANVEFAKANNGIMIFEAEFVDFSEKYPQIDIEDFKDFATKTGAVKSSTAKTSSDGTRVTMTRLNTQEAAAERGVLPENMVDYVSKIEQIYLLCKDLNTLMVNARCSFAIPKEKKNTEPTQ